MNRAQKKAASIFLAMRKHAEEAEPGFLSKYGPAVGGGLGGALLGGLAGSKVGDKKNLLRNILMGVAGGGLAGGLGGHVAGGGFGGFKGLSDKLKGLDLSSLLGGGGAPEAPALPAPQVPAA